MDAGSDSIPGTCSYMAKRTDAVTRFAVGAILWATTCTSCGHGPAAPIPLNIARINPAPMWQIWGQRAIDCAHELAAHSDSAPFRMVHDSVDVQSLVWIAVMTEQSDGGFPCKGIGSGKLASCDGQFRAPDSVLISAQRLEEKSVIAHEILHWAVESPGELQWRHGPPWGICEYY